MDDADLLNVTAIHVQPVAPQPGVPFWDQKWIEPALFDLLFCDPSQKTYLVVDATLRTNITQVFDLDTVDVPVRCLFQGEAEEKFAASAPYLVDLTLKGDAVSRFHRQFFTEHWDKGTGILLCSDASMDSIWRHLRKFTRSHSPVGSNRFFRFWETNATRDYFEAINAMPSRCKDIFEMKGGGWISKIVSCDERLGQTHIIAPNMPQILQADYSKGPFSLTPIEEEALLNGVLRGYAKSIEREIWSNVSHHDQVSRERLVFDAFMKHYANGERNVSAIRTAVMETLG